MSEVGSVTVKVGVGLDVSRETADVCARLVELYANENGADILLMRLPDGRYSLSIAGERE